MARIDDVNLLRVLRDSASILTFTCKLPARCRLPSLTWEFGFPRHSLNRRVSDVFVISDGGGYVRVAGPRLVRRFVNAGLAEEANNHGVSAREGQQPSSRLTLRHTTKTPRAHPRGRGVRCGSPQHCCGNPQRGWSRLQGRTYSPILAMSVGIRKVIRAPRRSCRAT